MDRNKLMGLLVAAADRYAGMTYVEVCSLDSDGLSEEGQESGAQGAAFDWQLEARILQRWKENEVEIVQLLLSISDGNHEFGTVVDYSSSGESSKGEVVEYIDGAATPIRNQ